MTDLDKRLGALDLALASNSAHAVDVALEVGASAATAGLSLREVFDRVGHLGADSHLQLVQAAALGWAEANEAFHLSLVCESPLTGLSAPSHLRSRLEGLYRAAERDDRRVSDTHALVVVEFEGGNIPLEDDLSALECAEALRLAFTGDEVFTRVHRRRVVVLADQGESDSLTVALVASLLARMPSVRSPFVWVEELPDSLAELTWTLAGLCR